VAISSTNRAFPKRATDGCGRSRSAARAWLRFQPRSQLARWYQKKFGKGNSRIRKIGIVALARKLLIAFWRYLDQGRSRRVPCCADNARQPAPSVSSLPGGSGSPLLSGLGSPTLEPFVRRGPVLSLASLRLWADSQSSGVRPRSTRIGGCSRAISSGERLEEAASRRRNVRQNDNGGHAVLLVTSLDHSLLMGLTDGAS